MRGASPSQRRLDSLCAIRRPLTEAEQREAIKLAKRVREAAQHRRRYAEDPTYRQRCIQRAMIRQGYA